MAEHCCLSNEPTADQLTFFETKIRPVLADHCYRCHSADAEKIKGGLRVDGRHALLQGGDLGPSILLEKPKESVFLKAIGWKDTELQMPPKKPLPDAIRDDLTQWVEMGAPWPGSDVSKAVVEPDSPIDFVAAREAHWAWKPVTKPKLPPEANGQEIDWLVERKLKEQALVRSAQAPKHTLIRRAYLDVIGLPPTPEQVATFVNGKQSWEALVDELLASEHYGARWGRHWLDVARFADGYGGFLDGGNFNQAWRYRDWVIEALNEDMPYNRFLRLQLAGDLIEPDTHTVATGFFALGPQYKGDGGDPQSNAIAKSETLDDRVDTFGRGLLGVTLACARCHDHKFDPIPTVDYYSIAGVFQNTRVIDHPLVPQAEVEAYDARIKEIGEFNKETDRQIQEAGDELSRKELTRLADYATAAMEWKQLEPRPDILKWSREQGYAGALFRFAGAFFSEDKNGSKLSQADSWFKTRSRASAEALQIYLIANPEEKEVKAFLKQAFKFDRNQVLDDLNPEIADLFRSRKVEHKKMNEAKPEKYASAHALSDHGRGNIKVAIRGNILTPGEEAPRRFLRILDDEQPPFGDGSGRMELAEALVDSNNPLTARVLVNRIWGWHVGHGLVRTPSNFGALGEEPSHPELLDWLAAEFVEKGWSLKGLHRKILTSATWKQSSQFDAAKFAIDGDNRLLWRMNSQKLSAEIIRDAVLAVSGTLNPTLGGEPFDNAETDLRRTIHARTSRNGDKFKSDAFLRVFDFPVPRSSVAKRTPTITPQQSLFMLNNPFMIAQAKAFAKRLELLEPPERINQAYQILFARKPEAEERDIGLQYLALEEDGGPLTRLERYSQALLASNEFIFVE